MDFKELVSINWKEIKEETIIHYDEVLELCKRPYPNHPKGCPNQEKCRSLAIPSFKEFKEKNKNYFYYLVHAYFDFGSYKQIRKREHPDWTEQQVKCVLYWQGSVKKHLADYIENIRKGNPPFYVYGCGSGLKLFFQKIVGSMEAARINVFSTLKLNRIPFELNPENNVILCCLLCSRVPLKFDIEKEKHVFYYLDKFCKQANGGSK